jgi:hypothetical protein
MNFFLTRLHAHFITEPICFPNPYFSPIIEREMQLLLTLEN